jgi:phospholipid/cholesterol/gamma-HCH transport system substrate-binding protein
MRNNTVETLIGAVVIAVAVLFVAFAYRNSGASATEGYDLIAKINRVDGIATGTDVKLAGIKVGTVKALALDPDYLVTVHMSINPDVKVPVDSSLVVTSSGLLSSSYLSISPGGSDKMLPPGGAIRYTQGAIDMMGLISKFAGGINGGNNSGNSGNADRAPAPDAQP